MIGIGPRLQAAGIEFTEVIARHRSGRARVDLIVLATNADLMKFAAWAGANDVDFDEARVATPAEIAASREWS
jgi:hypothetical protein